jgi:hypothetical protein
VVVAARAEVDLDEVEQRKRIRDGACAAAVVTVPDHR